MSTTPTPIDDRTELQPTPPDRVPTDEHEDEDDDRDAVELPSLTCPRDGSVLSMHHRTSPGRFSCPRCRSRWHVSEVYGK